MLQIVPHMRILVARQPLDLRKGIDGTAASCRRVLLEDPLSGAVFVFRNRSGTMIRILVYDGQGFWLMTKRLSKGRFRFWCGAGPQPSMHVEAHELVALLAGGDWTTATKTEPWRKVTPKVFREKKVDEGDRLL
jgi:transposase